MLATAKRRRVDRAARTDKWWPIRIQAELQADFSNRLGRRRFAGDYLSFDRGVRLQHLLPAPSFLLKNGAGYKDAGEAAIQHYR
jgi:hypothetical protein